MTDNNFNYLTKEESNVKTITKTFVAKAFLWMAAALALSSITAYLFAHNPELFSLIYKPEGGLSILGWVVIFAPFAFVLGMSAGFNKLSPVVMSLLFMAFAILMGASLSSIFIIYSPAAIYKTFLITTLMFGSMAVVGYVTKTDLTKFGSIMIMGLWGIIIATIINFFTHSATLDYIISFIGVVVFTGLTAYDTQNLKKIGEQMETNSDMAKKAAILGAMSLYLDFINLFLFLLRFFGNRNN